MTELVYRCTKPDDVPDRVCITPTSPFYLEDYRKLGVMSQGVARNDVVEFCVSEGWFRVYVLRNGKPVMGERGQAKTLLIRRAFQVSYRP